MIVMKYIEIIRLLLSKLLLSDITLSGYIFTITTI